MRSPQVGLIDQVAHTGFLLAEDEALKKYLSGLRVPTSPDSGKTTEVKVWFRYPEGERTITYPFITIDLVDIAPAYDLWTSEHVNDPEGLYQPSVSPTLPDPDANMGLAVRNYLAFRVSYQISVHCRNALHDRYLTSMFFTDVIPPRPFWMGVDADGTWRRTEMTDFIQADLMETTESGNKRIFRKVYTISMLAEVPQDLVAQAWQVLRVFVPVVDREYVDTYLSTVLTNNDGTSNLDPLGSFTESEREMAGEYETYYNISANASPEAALATGVANASS